MQQRQQKRHCASAKQQEIQHRQPNEQREQHERQNASKTTTGSNGSNTNTKKTTPTNNTSKNSCDNGKNNIKHYATCACHAHALALAQGGPQIARVAGRRRPCFAMEEGCFATLLAQRVDDSSNPVARCTQARCAPVRQGGRGGGTASPCSLNAICHSTCARTSHDAALRPCWAAGACASAGPQTGLACIFIGTQFLQGWRGRWAAKATTNRQSAPFFCFPRSNCQATRGPHARGKRPETPNQCSSMGSKLSLMMPLQPQTHPATLPEPLYS